MSLSRRLPVEPLLLAAATLLVAATTAPHLPPGPCFDDSGDLQVAAAALGIGHPPGYPGYVAVWHTFSRVTGLSPARAVTVLAWLAALLTLLLCGWIARQLGVRGTLGAAAVLSLALHPLVRANLVIPEVYAPSAGLLAGAVAALLSYTRRPHAGWLAGAAVPFAAAAANRPPLLAAAPFLAVAAALAMRRSGLPRAAVLRHSGLALAALVAPALFNVAYVWLRDAPSTPYNYIEAVSRATGQPPPADRGPAARFQRAAWLLAARQFQDNVLSEPAAIAARVRFAAGHVAPGPAWGGLLGLGLAGWVLLARRDAPVAWILGGIAAANVLFLLLYEARGLAADALPLLLVAAIGAAVALEALAGRFPPPVQPPLTALAAAGLALGCVTVLARYPAFLHDVDASVFLKRLDVASLPPRTRILATWRECTPLVYATLVSPGRPDIRILSVRIEEWAAAARAALEQDPGAPLLAVREFAAPAGLELVEFRGVWQVRATPGRTPAAEPG